MTTLASLVPLKVRYMSDVHLEFTNYDPQVLPSIGEDVVVLAGDIGVGTRGIEWAIQAIRDRPVLYVPGNHEFYRDDFVALIDEARDRAAGTQVHILPHVRAWISGHTHHSSVVEINGIPLYSNQRVYPRERVPFEWDACFEVAR